LGTDARVDLSGLIFFQASSRIAQLFEQQRRNVKEIMPPHWPGVSPGKFTIFVLNLHRIKPRKHRLAILERDVFLASNANPEEF
jgi:hypothetical protein